VKDDSHAPADEPHVYRPGELRDEADMLALVRRYERFAVDVDQRLKDICTLLSNMRGDFVTERDRIDQLERDFAEHRGVVNELGRKRTARKK
jgi:hypothetical protein